MVSHLDPSTKTLRLVSYFDETENRAGNPGTDLGQFAPLPGCPIAARHVIKPAGSLSF